MKSTFSIVSEDSPGVLMRIASLIYRRGYNIESLSVGRTDVPGLSRFTVIIEGEEGVYDQIRKQLMKLIEVIEVQNLTKDGPFVERWLSLVKVMAPVERRPHILQTAEIFRCRVVDLGSDAITLEYGGAQALRYSGDGRFRTGGARAHRIRELTDALKKSFFRKLLSPPALPASL